MTGSFNLASALEILSSDTSPHRRQKKKRKTKHHNHTPLLECLCININLAKDSFDFSFPFFFLVWTLFIQIRKMSDNFCLCPRMREAQVWLCSNQSRCFYHYHLWKEKTNVSLPYHRSFRNGHFLLLELHANFSVPPELLFPISL